MKKTKMILLDKFIDNAIDVDDYLLVDDLQDFVGLPKFIFSGGEYVEDDVVAAISIDEEAETLTIDGEVSYYDDFDFDFEFNEVSKEWEPVGVYVLYIDPAASEVIPVLNFEVEYDTSYTPAENEHLAYVITGSDVTVTENFINRDDPLFQLAKEDIPTIASNASGAVTETNTLEIFDGVTSIASGIEITGVFDPNDLTYTNHSASITGAYDEDSELTFVVTRTFSDGTDTVVLTFTYFIVL